MGECRMKPSEIKKLLRGGPCSVTFTKKDGTERKMVCTLKKDIIPKDMAPKGVGQKSDPKKVCPVYDLEEESWRSFRYDSVIDVVGYE